MAQLKFKYILHFCTMTLCFDDGTRSTNMTQRTSQDRRDNETFFLAVVSSSSISPSHLPSSPTRRPTSPPFLILLFLIPRNAVSPSQGLHLHGTTQTQQTSGQIYMHRVGFDPLTWQPSGGRLDALRRTHTYHAVPLPCCSVKGLNCIFPI
jgi:hypothetical protein